MTVDSEKKGPKNSRFQEPLKFFPVLFAWSIIMLLYLIFMVLHCIPSLAVSELHHRGVMETVIFNILTFLLMTCYIHCIAVHPGTVPDQEEDPSWEYVPTARTRTEADVLLETKRTGERRHCKWCAKYKPDRCHHCRVCRTCILRMDHHCPWIYNCVGFQNYKYFFLFIMYVDIDCFFIVFAMMGSVKKAVETSEPFMRTFLLLFGETLATFIVVLFTLFFLFHFWLMLKAMSTIEFCEKSMKKGSYDASVYSKGIYGNICAVLGDRPLLWLLPCSPPPGRGLYYLGEDMKLKREPETGRGLRGKSRKTSTYGATTQEPQSIEAGEPRLKSNAEAEPEATPQLTEAAA